MNEIIKPHSFEDAVQHIQAFSGQTSPDLGLDKVKSNGGLFGWFDHIVTGEELNKVIGRVQDYLIKFNGLHTEFISEFGQVYKALESLDKEYIPAILSAVKAAEEASNQAKAAQKDIKKTIDTQKKVIDILSDHKKKLDKYKHLENIDEIWKDIKSFEGDIKNLKEKLGKTEKQVDTDEKTIKAIQDSIDSIQKTINGLSKSYELLKAFMDKVASYTHLDDIDTIWQDIENYKSQITKLKNSISEEVGERKELEGIISEIRIIIEKVEAQEHLYEIDDIFEATNKNTEEIAAICNEITAYQGNLEEIKKIIQDKDFENQTIVNRLTKKLTIAYIIAGSAVGISIIELILNVLGII